MSRQRLPSPIEPTGLLAHLVASLPDWKRLRVKELLASGRVFVDGVSSRRHDVSVGPGDEIEIRETSGPVERAFPFPVLFEDACLIAIDKPNGLLTVGTRYERARTAYSIINHGLAGSREAAYIVHRLDRYTSGVLLLAKSESVQAIVMKQWGRAKKVYHALVEGNPKRPTARLEHFLREDERLVMRASDRATGNAVKASLSYEQVETGGGFALLRVALETGKKNQIRAQLAAMGHPIAGDAKYGAKSNPIGRLCLHASRLTLPHPKTKALVAIEAPLPKGFCAEAR